MHLVRVEKQAQKLSLKKRYRQNGVSWVRRNTGNMTQLQSHILLKILRHLQQKVHFSLFGKSAKWHHTVCMYVCVRLMCLWWHNRPTMLSEALYCEPCDLLKRSYYGHVDCFRKYVCREIETAGRKRSKSLLALFILSLFSVAVIDSDMTNTTTNNTWCVCSFSESSIIFSAI